MPNFFAFLTIYIWPFIAHYLCKTRNAIDGALLIILVPYLLLPVNTGIRIPIPGLPAIDKYTIASFAAITVLMMKYGKFPLLPKHSLQKFIYILLLAFPFFTWLTNLSPLSYYAGKLGNITHPALSPGAAIHSLVYVLTYLIFFIIGLRIFTTEESHKRMLQLIIIAGLAYSLLALYEIKMSPQLHMKVYGFFPHDWAQQKRQGGFRPVIFLGHGLYVAVFMCLAFIATYTFYKTKTYPVNKNGIYIVLYMATVVVLCKTWSAMIYAVLGFLFLAVLKKKLALKVCLVIAGLIFIFPMLRGAGLIPTDAITSYIDKQSEERAASLEFRFRNENLFLTKAAKKPFFGWGGSGRALVFDPETGERSVPDGSWVIIYAWYGWTGYIAIFGLLCSSIFIYFLKSRHLSEQQISPNTLCLVIILTMNLIDLIPNSSMSPITFLVAGAISGRTEKVRS